MILTLYRAQTRKLALARLDNELANLDQTNDLSPIKQLSDQVYSTPLTKALDRYASQLPDDAIKSLAFSGRYYSGDQAYEFDNFAKQMKFYRQNIKMPRTETSAGSLRGDYWEAVNGEPSVEPIVGVRQLNPYLLAMETNFYGLSWAFEESGFSALSLLDVSAEFASKKCDAILNEALTSIPVTHYLDKETGLELGREASVTLQGKPYKITIYYTYKMEDTPVTGTQSSASLSPADQPVMRLSGYRVILNDAELARAEVRSIRYNLGMPSWFFKP